MINSSKVFEVATSKVLPIKPVIVIRRSFFLPSLLLVHPNNGMKMAAATRYEVSTQEISVIVAEKLPCIIGMATETAKVSMPCMEPQGTIATATQKRSFGGK